jgi:hypothetical protein
MGKKTSVYLSDTLAEQVSDSDCTLAELLGRALAVEPLLKDAPEGDRNWTTVWFCPAPPEGVKFRVLSDGWHTGHDGEPCREIYKILITTETPHP